VIGIDQPGYGKTEGKSFQTRADESMGKGGPIDVILAVMKSMNIERAAFLGYDWGGGIGLVFAANYPKRVSKLVSIMPSYSESKPNELKSIVAPTLILWVKEDMMHN